jgi:hypothetical protein
MPRYTNPLRSWLAAVILCMIATEPWANAMQTMANRPYTTQTVDEAAVKKAVQQGVGQSPLFKIDKVAVASDYALVSWLQGEAGGVALLNKKSGGWKILANSGGWFGLGDLKKFGVPQSIAERLLTQIDPKWRNYE